MWMFIRKLKLHATHSDVKHSQELTQQAKINFLTNI
jgi:hypothetical protein